MIATLSQMPRPRPALRLALLALVMTAHALVPPPLDPERLARSLSRKTAVALGRVQRDWAALNMKVGGRRSSACALLSTLFHLSCVLTRPLRSNLNPHRSRSRLLVI